MYSVFNYNKNIFSGTEKMAQSFIENVLPHCSNFNKYNCIILPGIVDINALDNREIILWMHNPTYQIDGSERLIKSLLSRIKIIIVPSIWLKKEIEKTFNINKDSVLVINNYIDKIKFDKNKFFNIKKIKIINSVSANRSIDVLANSLKYIEDDFELNIFANINEETLKLTDLNDSRLIIHGRVSQDVLYKNIAESHIFAYPSCYEETFCISQIEAMGAGVLPVYNCVGALNEIPLNFGIKYFYHLPSFTNLNYKEYINEHSKVFASSLKDSINIVKNEYDPTEQSNLILDMYSFDKFLLAWDNLNSII